MCFASSDPPPPPDPVPAPAPVEPVAAPPPPPPPPVPAPPPPPPQVADPQVQAAGKAARAKATNAVGPSSTILTGPQGLQTPAQTTNKTLLGS